MLMKKVRNAIVFNVGKDNVLAVVSFASLEKRVLFYG